jgi:hypothetical protein
MGPRGLFVNAFSPALDSGECWLKYGNQVITLEEKKKEVRDEKKTDEARQRCGLVAVGRGDGGRRRSSYFKGVQDEIIGD